MSAVSTLKFHIVSAAPLFFGAPVFEKKKSDETHEQFEERTWQKKVRTTESGQVYIQPFALKNGLEAAGSRLNMKLMGKATYTKLFRQGVMINDAILLCDRSGKPVMIDKIQPLPMFVPSDGKRGSGKRVMRIFPQLQAWQAEVEIMCFDQRLTEDVVRAHLEEAGKFIGFGSMRVENGGVAGRFSVE
ncbi:MAG: hypothetical protein ACKO0Z_09630 [Betaproteobacteria bacterium]